MQMTDIHYRLMGEAVRQYGKDIAPAGGTIEASFAEDVNRGTMFLFCDTGATIHAISEEQLLTDCPTCGTPLVDGRCPQPARHE